MMAKLLATLAVAGALTVGLIHGPGPQPGQHIHQFCVQSYGCYAHTS